MSAELKVHPIVAVLTQKVAADGSLGVPAFKPETLDWLRTQLAQIKDPNEQNEALNQLIELGRFFESKSFGQAADTLFDLLANQPKIRDVLRASQAKRMEDVGQSFKKFVGPGETQQPEVPEDAGPKTSAKDLLRSLKLGTRG